EETLHDIVEPLVYSQATELIGEHRARGEDVVVISASGEELVKPIAAMLGVQHSVGTRMVIEDGRYTGEIEFYCFGEGKAAAIETLARLHGYDLASSYAYSDSSTDLPMLEAVGHPAVVNPSRGLHRIAVQRQWPELTFSDPTALSAKLASPSGGAVAATALGLGVAAGATWYGLRHKRAT
ncbi:MAG: HAD family hydrolase, partial [Sciscionella sp.]